MLVYAATVISAILSLGFLVIGAVYYIRRKRGKMMLCFGATMLFIIAAFLIVSQGINPDLISTSTIVVAIIIGLGFVVDGIFWIINDPKHKS